MELSPPTGEKSSHQGAELGFWNGCSVLGEEILGKCGVKAASLQLLPVWKGSREEPQGSRTSRGLDPSVPPGFCHVGKARGMGCTFPRVSWKEN